MVMATVSENSAIVGSSRLIVKNLPKSTSVEKLRTHFGSKGDVTDVQLKYTPDGQFRNFGFIGFKNEEDAEVACNYFNNTYIGATKIQVEKCAALDDPNKPRAWSKYAPEKTEKGSKKRKLEKNPEDDNEEVVVKKKKEEELLEKCKEDPDFVEFLQSHRKKNAWANDDIFDELEKSVAQVNKKTKKAKNEPMKPEDDDPTEETLVGKKDKSKAKSKDVDVSQKEKVEKIKKLPENEFFTVKLRDLPKKARKKDIKKFFENMSLKSIRIPPKIRGIAYVGFETEKDRTKALTKNKSIILGKKVAVYKYDSERTDVVQSKKSKWALQQEALEKETETVGESGRIFIRNLSYTASEDDIRTLFEKFGPLTEVNLPLDRLTRRIKGIGFVTFMLPEHATKAFNKLDGTTFQGRMLHLLPSKSKDELTDDSVNAGSSYKTDKELKKKKTAGQTRNWNTLFLGQNAVAEVVSTKYGVSREEFLLDNNDEKDSYQASAAVRMALAETEVVTDTKTFLEQNGVSLEAFEGTRPERSRTVLLVRNLVAGTQVGDLTDLFAKYGEVGRVVMPPSGITAIVEFLEPAEARRAFTKLAYTKFGQMPMYLEWAPVETFKTKATRSVKTKNDKNLIPPLINESNIEKTEERISSKDKQKEKLDNSPISESKETTLSQLEPVMDENMIAEPDTTLFVKNLNFATEEPNLKQHFQSCGPIFSVSVARRRDSAHPGKSLSQGYGFVQYYFTKDAMTALKDMQGSVLQNHTLELKKSNRTLQTADDSVQQGKGKSEKESTKMLVRNIPFQATKKEVCDLFKTFGQLKAVRLPTKMDGSGEHRGFAFVEFNTTKDAKSAFTTLSKSTHLYGRRLVLEWAAADETVEELRAKTAKKYDLQTAGERETKNAKTKTKQMMRYFDEKVSKSKTNEGNNDDDDDDE